MVGRKGGALAANREANAAATDAATGSGLTELVSNMCEAKATLHYLRECRSISLAFRETIGRHVSSVDSGVGRHKLGHQLLPQERQMVIGALLCRQFEARGSKVAKDGVAVRDGLNGHWNATLSCGPHHCRS